MSTTSVNKLWQKEGQAELDPTVEAFTVGNDYLLDMRLLKYDIRASVAHASGLTKVGILSPEEFEVLARELGELERMVDDAQFKISREDEDGHTAIENYLVAKCGEVGKKIHTGRSRNDQVLVATRLFLKDQAVRIEDLVHELLAALEQAVKANGRLPMPGYTHMQRAMPSTAGMWLGSFFDALGDDLTLLAAVQRIIDQNPLGSVAGYGESTLGLDRQHTTELLGFARVQENPMYCAMSRGKFELMYLQAGQQLVFSLGKLATDLMLFTTKEFDFCYLPISLTTGSSVMPQKRNYDVCELLRANASRYDGLVMTLAGVIGKLPSGYNRDFQLTKELALDGCTLLEDLIVVSTLVVKNLGFKKSQMSEACSPELYAAEEAYELVKKEGLSFREAYRRVGKKYNQ